LVTLSIRQVQATPANAPAGDVAVGVPDLLCRWMS
jgi:hypothetical protein